MLLFIYKLWVVSMICHIESMICHIVILSTKKMICFSHDLNHLDLFSMQILKIFLKKIFISLGDGKKDFILLGNDEFGTALRNDIFLFQSITNLPSFTNCGEKRTYFSRKLVIEYVFPIFKCISIKKETFSLTLIMFTNYGNV